MISFAIALTRSWTATYTRGLPADLRQERREEIDCDLWEHQRLADLQREPVTVTAVEILLRLLFGVPADIFWRLEASAHACSERGTQMNESAAMKAILAIAIAVAALPMVIGLIAIVGLNSEMRSDSDRLLAGPLWVLIGAVIIAGLVLSSRRPVLGVGLVIPGTVAISVILYWAAVITVPIGLGLVAVAYWRARQNGRPGSLRPA